MTEGEKRKMSKETGPVTQDVPVETVIEQHVQNADDSVREQLQQTLQEFKDVFPDQLPFGPPPKRIVDHEIDTLPGEAPPHKSPYRLSTAELDELKRQIDVLLEQGWIRPVQAHTAHPSFSSPRRMGNGACALTTGL